MKVKIVIIDFHTHTFPEAMAPKTIKILEEKAGFKAILNGTLKDLYTSMEDSGVDISVILPVVTSPKQLKKINDLAIENNKLEKIISFGGIHPDNEEFESELERLKENGIKGIKIHPDYQGCFFDDDRYVRIIDKAFSLGLIVITHSGVDYGFDGEVHTTCERVLNLLERIKHKGILILAHMGWTHNWDEVIDKLAGKDVYFDLALSLGNLYHNGEIQPLMSEETLKKFIDKHGSKKILFATDSPWCNQKEAINVLNSFSLPFEVKEDIFSNNAKRILGI